ncbi:MAG: hypothetical protein ACQXXJ_02195 [Candidatus Bathyarchaeia archaeon]|jgi:hypothetical protein
MGKTKTGVQRQQRKQLRRGNRQVKRQDTLTIRRLRREREKLHYALDSLELELNRLQLMRVARHEQLQQEIHARDRRGEYVV